MPETPQATIEAASQLIERSQDAIKTHQDRLTGTSQDDLTLDLGLDEDLTGLLNAHSLRLSLEAILMMQLLREVRQMRKFQSPPANTENPPSA